MDNIDNSRVLLPTPLLSSAASTAAERGSNSDALAGKSASGGDSVNRLLSGEISSSSGSLKPDANCGTPNAATAQYFFADWKLQHRQQKTALDGGGDLLWHAGHVSPSSSSGAMSSPVVSSNMEFAGGATNNNANFQMFMDHNGGGDALQYRPATTAQMQPAFSLYGSTPEQQQSFNNFLLAGNSNSNDGNFVDQLQSFTLSSPRGGNWASPGLTQQQSKQQNAPFLADYMSASSSASTMDGMHAGMVQQQFMDRNKLWNSGSSSLTGSPQHQHRLINQEYSSLLQQQQQQQLYQSSTRVARQNVIGRFSSVNDNGFGGGVGPSGDGIGNHDVFTTSKMFPQDLGYQQPGAVFMQQQQQQMPYKTMPASQQQQQSYSSRRTSWSPVPGASPAGSVPPSPYVAVQQPAMHQQQGVCGYYCSSNMGSRARGLPVSSGSSGSGSGSVRQQQTAVPASFAIGHWNSSEEAKALQQQQNVQAHHHQYHAQHYHQQQQQYSMMSRPQQTLMMQSAGDLNGGAMKSVNSGKEEEVFDFNGKFGMFVADPTIYGGKQQQGGSNSELKQQHTDNSSTASKPLASTGINNFFNQLANEDHVSHVVSNQQPKPKRVIPGLTTAPAAGASSATKKGSRASRQRSSNANSGGGQSIDVGVNQQPNVHQAPPPAPVVDMDAVAAAVVQLSNTPFSYAAVARKKTFATNSGGSSTTESAVGGAGGAGTPHPQPGAGEAGGLLIRSRTASVDTGLHAVNPGRSQSAAPSSPATAVRGSNSTTAADAGWHEVGSKQLNRAGITIAAKKAASGLLMGKKSLNKNKTVAGKKRLSVSKSSNASSSNKADVDGSVGTANKFANISVSDDEDDGYAGGREGNVSDSTVESPDELTLNNMKQIDMNSLRKARATLQLTNNDLSSSMDGGLSTSAGQMILMDKLNNQLKAADSSGYYAMAGAFAGKKMSNKNTNIQQQLLAEEKLAGSLSSSVVDGGNTSGPANVGGEEKTAAGYQFSVASVLYTILCFAFLFVKIPLVKTCTFVIFMVRSVLDSLWHVWLELYQSTLFATKHSSKSLKNLQASWRRNWLKFKRAFANGGREQHHQRESSHHHHYHHPGGGGGGSDSKFVNALTTGDQVMRRLYYVDSVLGWNPYDILGVSDSDKREVVEEQMAKTVDLVLQDVALRYGVAEAIKLLTWAVKSIVDEAKKKDIDKALKNNSCIMPSIVGDAECFLQRMREKYDTKTEYQLPCYRCGKKHMRHKVENRDLLNGRYCKSCGSHHQVKEGDIWCETSFLGLVTRYFACVDGLIYDITAFAMCQKSDLPELKPNTHQIYYRIPSPDVYVEDMWLNDLKSCRKPKILGSVAPRSEAMPCGRAARRRKVRAK